MTDTHNESLPFDDFDDYMRKTIERMINNAFETKQIDEVTYRRLCVQIAEYSDSDLDYMDHVLQNLQDSLETNMLDRLVRGAEFIESIDETDRRYEPATKKFEELSTNFQENKERRDEFERNHTGHTTDQREDGQRTRPA